MQVEQQVSDTILQKPLTVTAGGKTYDVARPTPATLIEVSACIASLPKVENIDKDKIVPYTLSIAKEYYPTLLRIAAILIIGAKAIKQEREESVTRGWRWPFGKTREKGKGIVDSLVEELKYNASNEEVNNIIASCLSYQEIGFFLSTIISLGEANVLETTKT